MITMWKRRHRRSATPTHISARTEDVPSKKPTWHLGREDSWRSCHLSNSQHRGCAAEVGRASFGLDDFFHTAKRSRVLPSPATHKSLGVSPYVHKGVLKVLVPLTARFTISSQQVFKHNSSGAQVKLLLAIATGEEQSCRDSSKRKQNRLVIRQKHCRMRKLSGSGKL